MQSNPLATFKSWFVACALDGVEECQERASVQCPEWPGRLRLHLHQHGRGAGGPGRRAAPPVWRSAFLANSQAGGPGRRPSREAHHNPDQSAYRKRFVSHRSSANLRAVWGGSQWEQLSVYSSLQQNYMVLAAVQHLRKMCLFKLKNDEHHGLIRKVWFLNVSWFW